MRQKSSCFEGTSEAVEERSVTLVSCEAEDGGSVGAYEPSCAIEDLKAERLRVFQQKETGMFLGSIPARCSGINLKGDKQVVSDGNKLLPGTIGPVAASGNGIESKLTFEDTDYSFVFSTASHGVPYMSRGPVEVGGDGTVLIIAVVGVEEIKLVVFGRTMEHAFSVNHNPQGHTPAMDGQSDLEAAHSCGKTLPSATGLDDGGEIEPSPKRHFDAIASTATVEQTDDRTQEKGPIHAEIQVVPVMSGFVYLPEDLSQEGDRGLAIMDIAGAILHPEDLAGLGQMSSDGIVTGDLAVMRIETPKCSLCGIPRGDDRSIDIDGERAKRDRLDHPSDHLGIDLLEPSNRCIREVSKPTAECTQARYPRKPTESLEENIAAEEIEVTQSPTTYDQQSQCHSDHGDRTVISRQPETSEVAANPIVKADRAQVANEKLKACVGTQSCLGELNSKILLDRSAQRGFPISHSKWPFVVGLKLDCIPTFSHSERLFCKYEVSDVSEFMTH